MEKILITGTGRCGTTFLILLFSFLNYDTGYNKTNYIEDIFPNCNSGMESLYTEEKYILKNPLFLEQIEEIACCKDMTIKYVIIPIRDYAVSVKSRVFLENENKNNKKHEKEDEKEYVCGTVPGGLVKAVDYDTQLAYYRQTMSNYIYIMTKYEINTVFINFDKMISDKKYLFDKLTPILDGKNINFDLFSEAFDEVSIISKRKAA